MPSLSINSSTLFPGCSFFFRSSNDCAGNTTKGRVGLLGVRWVAPEVAVCAHALTVNNMRKAVPLKVLCLFNVIFLLVLFRFIPIRLPGFAAGKLIALQRGRFHLDAKAGRPGQHVSIALRHY